MKTETKTCAHCGFEIVGRWERLSKALVETLDQFAKVSKGYPREFSSCGLHHTRINNAQKLQYFGLIEKAANNKWSVTPLGFRFLDGFADVPLQVFKVKGKAEIERVSVERVHIADVIKKKEVFKTKFERIKLEQKLFV